MWLLITMTVGQTDESKFSKFNPTVNQNTKWLTLTPTSFLKETCLPGAPSSRLAIFHLLKKWPFTYFFKLLLFCLFIIIFVFILNYVLIVNLGIFIYYKIWILLNIYCFIWNYFATCLEVFWGVMSKLISAGPDQQESWKGEHALLPHWLCNQKHPSGHM